MAMGLSRLNSKRLAFYSQLASIELMIIFGKYTFLGYQLVMIE